MNKSIMSIVLSPFTNPLTFKKKNKKNVIIFVMFCYSVLKLLKTSNLLTLVVFKICHVLNLNSDDLKLKALSINWNETALIYEPIHRQ